MNLNKKMLFTKKLQFLYKSGKPLIEALESLSRNEKDQHFKRLFQESVEEIKAGGSLYSAFKKQEDEFGSVYCQLIKAGESSGKLDIVLEHLVEMLTSMINIRRQIISASIYPAAVLILMPTVFISLFIFIISAITKYMNDLNYELPPVMAFLSFIMSSMCSCPGIIALIIIIGMVILFLYIYTNVEGLSWFRSRLLVMLPGFGHLEKYGNIYSFIFTLKICYEAGLTILDSIALATENVTNDYLFDKFARSYETIKDGGTLAFALDQTGLFNYELVDMIKTGEESGKLEEALKEVLNQIDSKIKNVMMIMMAAMKPLGMILGFLFVILLFGLIGTIIFSILSKALSKI